jgi:hypothetical protein
MSQSEELYEEFDQAIEDFERRMGQQLTGSEKPSLWSSLRQTASPARISANNPTPSAHAAFGYAAAKGAR